jgi:hypothetical protein
MSDRDDILKILDKVGIEYEESEDSECKIYTESGVEFIFKKNGGLKSLGQIGELIKSIDKEGNSWKYYGVESDEDDDL